MMGATSDQEEDALLEKAALLSLGAKSNDASGARVLADWIAADPAHRQAADRIARAWDDVDDLKGDPRLDRMSREAFALIDQGTPAAGLWFTRHRVQLAAACACFFLLCSAPFLLDRSAKREAMILTNTGNAVRTFRLADGSFAVLDVGSRLTVDMSGKKRNVALETGRARFTVVHDADRAFHVMANDRDVQAIGTQFIVDVGTPAKVVVDLLQGKVDVSSVTSRPAWFGLARTMARSKPIRMHSGQELVAIDGGLPRLRPFDRTEATAWERGMIVLKRRTVAEGAEAVNRHARVPVRIASDVPRDLTVSGSFEAGDSAGFAENLTLIYPQLAVVRGKALHVVLKPE